MSYNSNTRIGNKNIEEVMQREDKVRFRLKAQEEEFIFKPEERQFAFYQICGYPIDKKYEVRKVIYDENGEMITHREKRLKKDILEKFLKKSPEYRYTVYPTYQLSAIGFPEDGEILMAKSSILNNF
jgi:hypothetical protein